MLGADDDDDRRIGQAHLLQLADEFAERLVDKIEFPRQAGTRRAENVGVAALLSRDGIDRQLLSNAHRLEVGAEQGRHADTSSICVMKKSLSAMAVVVSLPTT